MSDDGAGSSNAAGRRSTIQDTRISGGSPESIRCQRPATWSRSSARRPSTTTGVSAPTVTSSPARVQARPLVDPAPVRQLVGQRPGVARHPSLPSITT